MGQNIKRINKPQSFDDLYKVAKEMVTKAGQCEPFTITYKDSDGDWISIEDQNDYDMAIALAVSLNSTIKLVVQGKDAVVENPVA